MRDRREAVSAFTRDVYSSPVVRANVYVDGFNLYHALRDTPYKWLDLRKLARFLLPNDRIHRVRYFTSRITVPRDQPKEQNQQAYIRALKTLPRLSVHYGTCRSDSEFLPRAGGKPGQHELVIERKQKGSDVNLASMLLADGFRGDYEVAVVVSDDSDLVLPIKIVTNQLRLPVGAYARLTSPTPPAAIQSPDSYLNEMPTLTR